MQIDILSLFPNYFKSPLGESILKKAIDQGLIKVNSRDIRDFCEGKHKQADDRPYGGGPGMVLMPKPLTHAIRTYRKEQTKVVYLSPQGAVLNHVKAQELAKETHLILLCGHYEGIDERVIEKEIDEEISIGDYVLTNGCLAACVLIDVVSRFIPGVLGHHESAISDSFAKEGLLDCPHYTRPQQFEELKVPEVLLSGNHYEIEAYRARKALEQTKKKRPDLLKR